MPASPAHTTTTADVVGTDTKATSPPPVVGDCQFAVPPANPYFWDAGCIEAGGGVGGLADGMHLACRWCGFGPYASCPWLPKGDCQFAVPPSNPHFWDASCVEAGGGVGCNADGTHLACRWCGFGPYISCPALLQPSVTPPSPTQTTIAAAVIDTDTTATPPPPV